MKATVAEKERMRKYYQLHRQKLLVYQKTYRLQHLPERKEYLKNYNSTHKVLLSVKKAAYQKSEKGKIVHNKANRLYNIAHADSCQAYRMLPTTIAKHKAYLKIYNVDYQKTTEYKSAHIARQNAHKRNSIILEPVNRDLLIFSHQARCAYCGCDLKFDGTTHIEHMIPIVHYARLGKKFPYKYSTVVPSCAHCNLSKGDKTPLEFFWGREVA